MNKLETELSIPSIVKTGASLKPFNTFSFDYAAQYFAIVHSEIELFEVICWANSNDLSVTILGGGSNLLIQGDIDGLVIVNKIIGREILHDLADTVTVQFAAGEVWHDCVTWAVDQGLGGIENLALIPGSAGAAPVQNIGAYGVEIKDILQTVKVLDRRSLEIKYFDAHDCDFGYRDSLFKHEWKELYIILAIELRLEKTPKLNLSYGGLNKLLGADSTVREVYDCVCKIRSEKLPNPEKLSNSGSFFKNPIVTNEHYAQLKMKYPDIVAFPYGDSWKLAAGWMNDKAGWKGVRRDGVGVYDKQALVLVNFNCDKADALLQLERDIKSSINGLFDVQLEREPILLGTNE
ncbi:UDP-N-acetylmuramate dehydrogenase [Marinomonas ostreistagni]|uniref:UDP-N-acetylenolpyruvoylglucosamine reductase n=1 Tax=Marinomonas ostreistagni TaxID=359209 RepID=A0ABS0Z7M9_9GAMM|nr:UDP-N-acetylmuramate dehydrogenase [Marinomonas ostreistagni]MBJ7549438.1 UDP-N-acetylmuramate dehydrogenase [Marinomonas ostreistagni]